MTYKFSYETIFWVYKENDKWECSELSEHSTHNCSAFNVDVPSDFDSYLYEFTIEDIFNENHIELEEGFFHYWGVLETNWFTGYGECEPESDAETYATEEVIIKLSPEQVKYYKLDKDEDEKIS